jgi:hypothetical protein
MYRRILAAMAATFWMASPATGQKPDFEIGMLSCSIAAPTEASESAAAPTEGQTREALCSFKPKKGAEESYVGLISGVSLSFDKTATVIWTVKAGTDAVTPGMLQQSYAVDRDVPADQMPPMIGEANSGIVLQTLRDKPEGSASQMPKPKGFVIVGLELKLKSAAG